MNQAKPSAAADRIPSTGESSGRPAGGEQERHLLPDRPARPSPVDARSAPPRRRAGARRRPPARAAPPRAGARSRAAPRRCRSSGRVDRSAAGDRPAEYDELGVERQLADLLGGAVGAGGDREVAVVELGGERGAGVRRTRHRRRSTRRVRCGRCGPGGSGATCGASSRETDRGVSIIRLVTAQIDEGHGERRVVGAARRVRAARRGGAYLDGLHRRAGGRHRRRRRSAAPRRRRARRLRSPPRISGRRRREPTLARREAPRAVTLARRARGRALAWRLDTHTPQASETPCTRRRSGQRHSSAARPFTIRSERARIAFAPPPADRIRSGARTASARRTRQQRVARGEHAGLLAVQRPRQPLGHHGGTSCSSATSHSQRSSARRELVVQVPSRGRNRTAVEHVPGEHPQVHF